MRTTDGPTTPTTPHASTLGPSTWFPWAAGLLGLIGAILLVIGIGLQVRGPLADAAAVANQIALVTDQSRIAIRQSAKAALTAREAVAQAHSAYHSFSVEMAPALSQGLGRVMAISQRLGAIFTAVAGYLNISIPGGLDWKGWTSIPGLTYAHPLRPAADALAAGGREFASLSQAFQEAQAVLHDQDPSRERVTPALDDVEQLLGDLGNQRLPALDLAVADIGLGASRTALGLTTLAWVICLIGMGFIAIALLGWRLGRQLATLPPWSATLTPPPST